MSRRGVHSVQAGFGETSERDAHEAGEWDCRTGWYGLENGGKAMTQKSADGNPPVAASNLEPLFNLPDEPWIPVLWRKRPESVVPEESAHVPSRKRKHLDAERSEIGVLDALEHASSIRSFANSTPIVNLALLRFLMAVLHAAGVTRDDGASAWTPKLDTYFEKWRDRFWLYHPQHPFMQAGHGNLNRRAFDAQRQLDRCVEIESRLSKALSQGGSPALKKQRKDAREQKRAAEGHLKLVKGAVAATPGMERFPEYRGGVGVSRLFHQLRAGVDSIHFAHCADGDTRLSLAECACGLMLLPLAAIGARKGRTASPPGTGPIFLIPNGTNLSETLRLNLPEFARAAGDSPSWEDVERPQNGQVGLLDGLTWQSRSALLSPPDAQGMVATMLYGSGRSTADVKANHANDGSGSRLWDDPHGLGSKHPVPYENQRDAAIPNDATATYHTQIQKRIGAYKPPTVRHAEHAGQSARIDAVAVSGDGQFAFYHIDGRPAFDMREGNLTPVTWAQHFFDRAEEIKNRNKLAFGQRKGREQRARSGQATEELVFITRNALTALPSRFPRLEQERDNVATFINKLTEKTPKPDDEHFGFVEQTRLRVPLSDGEEDLVPLTDFFNYEVRNRGLLTGWRRRWAWIVARLYAHYPHHQPNSSFGAGLKPLMAEEGLRRHAECLLLTLATCSIEDVESGLRRLFDLLRHARRKQQLTMDFEALLLDLLSIEEHQPSVVGHWFMDGKQP